MSEIVDHLDSKNLVPFKRRRNGYHVPVLKKEEEEQVIDEVDPELRPEEQGYVRHYLAYADRMLKQAEPESEGERTEEKEGRQGPPEDTQERTSARTGNVMELPKRSSEDDEEDSNAA